MANYTSAFTGAEIDASVGTIKTGVANPTTSTVGALGQIFRNTATGKLFRCTAIAGSVYTWEGIFEYTYGQAQPASGLWIEEVN